MFKQSVISFQRESYDGLNGHLNYVNLNYKILDYQNLDYYGTVACRWNFSGVPQNIYKYEKAWKIEYFYHFSHIFAL